MMDSKTCKITREFIVHVVFKRLHIAENRKREKGIDVITP